MALAVVLLPAHGLSCAVSAGQVKAERAGEQTTQVMPPCHGGASQAGKLSVSASPSGGMDHCADEGDCVCQSTQVPAIQTVLAGDGAAENLSHFVLPVFWQSPVMAQALWPQKVMVSPPVRSAVPLRVQLSSWLI